MQSRQSVYESRLPDQLFPFRVFRNDSGSGEAFMEQFMYCHWHPECEFIYVQEGEARFEIHTEQIVARQGQAVMINFGQLHTGFSVNRQQCIVHAIKFDESLFCFGPTEFCQKQFIEPFVTGEYLLPTVITGDLLWEQTILKHIEDLVRIATNPTYGYQLKIKITLCLIFYELIVNRAYRLASSLPERCGQQQITRIKAVIQFIEKNYHEYLQIQDLAQATHISSDQLYKDFRKILGISPIEYLIQYRLSQALQLLRTDDQKIVDVAHAVGFNNVSHFIRCFKRLHKVTPGWYRNAYAAERVVETKVIP